MTNAAQNLKPRVKEIVRPAYTWKQLYDVWTVDPSKAVFFPAKVVDGQEWSATYITEVEFTDAHGVTVNHRVRLYGDVAEKANKILKQQGQIALIRAEGHVKQEAWEDEQGRPHTSHSTVVKRDRLQILDVRPWEAPIELDPSGDPFARFEPAPVDMSEVAAATASPVDHAQAQARYSDPLDTQVQCEERTRTTWPRCTGSLLTTTKRARIWTRLRSNNLMRLNSSGRCTAKVLGRKN